MSTNKKKLDTSSLIDGLDDEDILAEVSDPQQELPELPAERRMSGQRTVEVKKKRTMILELDPRECRRWRYYDRFEEWFTYENCRDLIEDLRVNEQEMPGIVRKLENDPDGYKWEVIFAGRRHFACDYIIEHDDVFKPFKAIHRELTDQEAARLMDMENRKRKDISDFERCVSYRQQMGKVDGYDPIFGSLNQLREAIEADKDDADSSLTKAALSQMVKAGELNEIPELIALFKGRRIKIPWTHAYHLMMLWGDKENGTKNRKKILARASELSEEASSRTPEYLLKALMEIDKVEPVSHYNENFKHEGKIAVKAVASKKDLAIKIPLKMLQETDDAVLLELVKQAMSNAQN